MPSSTSFHGSGEAGSSWPAVRLLLATLSGPLAWLIALEAVYVASYAPCDPGRSGHLHASILGPFLLCLGGAALAWFTHPPRRFSEDHGWANTLAHAALWLSLAFAVLILINYIPVQGLEPCL